VDRNLGQGRVRIVNGLLALGLVVSALSALLVVFLIRRHPIGAGAVTGRRLVADVPATPVTIALLERWRDRASRWRSTLAVPVVVATIATSIAVRQSLDVGIGAHPAWADPLLTGMLSVFLGAIAAELHHLRHRPTGPRVVERLPRDVAAHLPLGARRRRLALALLAGVASVLSITVGDGRVPWPGMLALAITGAVPLVQRGIVGRSRPALDADLRAADDAVRTLAVRSVDEAGAGAAVLLAAWQLAPAYTSVDVSTPVAAAMIVAQVAALVLAILWWRRSNPRRLLPDVPAALDRTDHLSPTA
jgi:hypothetical protein